MRARVLTALALIPPVLAAVFCTSPWPLAGLLLLIVFLGLTEIKRLTGQAFVWLGAPIILATLGFLSIDAFVNFGFKAEAEPHAWHQTLAVTAAINFFASVLSISISNPIEKKNNVISLLHSGWVLGPCFSILALHQFFASNETWLFGTPLLLAIVPLWAGDTAAIFAGKAFGKHKLAPTISPKKTVEGGIANLLACMLAAWGLGIAVGIPLAQSVVCGFIAGIFGQAGDLFESWVKRRVDMKDSGTLLPGHGGILDRIDSILFTAPFVALVLLLWK